MTILIVVYLICANQNFVTTFIMKDLRVALNIVTYSLGVLIEPLILIPMAIALRRTTKVVEATHFTDLNVVMMIAHVTMISIVLLLSVASLIIIIVFALVPEKRFECIFTDSIMVSVKTLVRSLVLCFLQYVVHNIVRPFGKTRNEVTPLMELDQIENSLKSRISEHLKSKARENYNAFMEDQF